jgi:hypothetical protein
MSLHRKRPAPRHQAPGRHGHSGAPQAQARSVGAAFRRTAVTPTFAAGLGVVLAGVLALTTARTVIRYGPDPDPSAGGHPCPVRNCVTTGPGEPAIVNPGRKLATPVPARMRSHGVAQATARPTPGARGGTPHSGPAVQYQTVHQWAGGFLEQVVVSTSPDRVPAGWNLLLTYPGAQIVHVWGGTWVPENSHTALVKPWDAGGYTPSGSEIRVYLVVTGQPGPPSRCSFDGRTCRSA